MVVGKKEYSKWKSNVDVIFFFFWCPYQFRDINVRLIVSFVDLKIQFSLGPRIFTRIIAIWDIRICRVENNFRPNKTSALSIVGFEYLIQDNEANKWIPELQGHYGIRDTLSWLWILEIGLDPGSAILKHRTLPQSLSTSLRFIYLWSGGITFIYLVGLNRSLSEICWRNS